MADKQTRVREFVRNYDYENGTATVKDSSGATLAEVSLSRVAAAIVNGFALQRITQYVVNAGRAAIEDGKDTLEAINTALTELQNGEIDLRDGSGVGVAGMTEQLGAILVEMGKSSLKFAGKEYAFADAAAAGAALKTLWSENPSIKRGEKEYSARNLINDIKSQPEIKARLVKKEKKAATVADFLA